MVGWKEGGRGVREGGREGGRGDEGGREGEEEKESLPKKQVINMPGSIITCKPLSLIMLMIQTDLS